ncbi:MULTISPECIES: iron-containing alcohol dehydrogenase [Mycolicibacterium]|uniref:NAD-dependent methanol dehydrogenase n=1 Tax=Mycolicibacterium mageritense TaxID=53462 RepID=A0AAI8TUT2_MYCME|nr:iron-containing alcohol dehydrogenase [Mycolicibacterium mageritense]MBN3454990.1 iron-containing alcohol dehydrogenase [Mycobacterium sp. DSM 3803]TXI61316.1 MAG: iron-containing alcohol dehydrogenase [Mycolicibacterium mageritense]BDY28942.1 NAD-dependent methanol dehydrogenase [Mycolicibacterium mageritense]GJJ20660.1 alcohol dehydrogenase [Mycolicibacterium mageritense]
MVTNIALPRFAKIGAGAVDDLGTVVAQLGIRRPVLVTDRYLTDTGQVERLVKTLHAAGSEAAVFSETVPDPTITSLSGGLDLVKAHRADGIIGFGGGSPMDTAKALAVLSANGGSIASYKAPNTYTGPALPVVAVPTTAGSGSEATQFTVITDDDSDEKMLCPGLSFLPIAIVVDFELTVSMPARLTADTGVDALTHAIEAYVSRRASPFSDALALAAMRSISQHLRRAYADGADQRAREAMMLASTQAGMAFSNSSVALVHGMSRPIGGHFHVAHGLSNAMLLPAVTKFSIESAVDRYADCAKAMGVVGESVASGQAATALVAELQQLCEDVEVPTPQSYGIDKGDWESRLEIMAEQALASGSPGNNPRVPSKDEIIELYREIY